MGERTGTDVMRAFLDESSRVLDDVLQEYLVGAALLNARECDDVREEL